MSFIWYLIPACLSLIYIGLVIKYIVFRGCAENKIIPSSKPVENSYGHPYQPVSWLRSHIRKAPLGAAWEIKVHHDDNGNPWLHLSLIDLATGDAIATSKRDLINGYGYTGEHTWAFAYREYPTLTKGTFKNDFMGPILDWSEKVYNQYANKNADGEYSLS